MPVNIKLKQKYPLLYKGYDILECPLCEKECYPDAETADGTVIYNRHNCKPTYANESISRRFEINSNGDIID